jgi:hypothetical protein
VGTRLVVVGGRRRGFVGVHGEVELVEASERSGQGGGPRPGLVEVQGVLSAGGGDFGGDMPHRPAQLFRFGFGHRPLQAQGLGPGVIRAQAMSTVCSHAWLAW